MSCKALLRLFLFVLAMPNMLLAEDIRLYEMLNAGQTAETHPPLVDLVNFDNNGYCFTVQQVIARNGTAKVRAIHYADENGQWLTFARAAESDAVKLNRIKVEYEETPVWLPEGIRVYVNGNDIISWRCNDYRTPIADIPPKGWYVVDPKKKLTAWSLERDGNQADYIDSPEYLFADVRGNPKGKPQRFDRLLCDKQLLVRKNIDEEGRWEMIVGNPGDTSRSTFHAVRLDDNATASVIALDIHRKEIGTAETRYSRGMVHVMPVKGAFSYLLTPKPTRSVRNFMGEPGPNSAALQVTPGTHVMIRRYDLVMDMDTEIPIDAKPGTLLWLDGLDFEIVPLYDVSASHAAGKLTLTVKPNYQRKQKAQIELFHDGKIKNDDFIETQQGDSFALTLDIEPSSEPKASLVELRIETLGFYRRESSVFVKKYRLIPTQGSLVLERVPD